MCDTNEHMLIGETAASWIPQMLRKICGVASGTPPDYDPTQHLADYHDSPIIDTGHSTNIFGDGGWFSSTQMGQFRLAAGRTDDWASYGDILALSGDYYQDEGSMISDPNRTERLIQAWKLSIATGRGVSDPNHGEMIRRAMSNWSHFGHEGISLWLQVHREALDIAIRGRRNALRDDEMNDVSVRDMGLTQVMAGLILALRHNAFGDHYLSDFFSSGHLRVQRHEFFTYLGGGALGTTIPGTGTLLRTQGDVGRDVDVASVISGIGHDEDGRWGLWCKTHFAPNGFTLNGLDGVTAVAAWDAPLSGNVSHFFARGDDGLAVTPENNTTRALCYYAIGLSIRDVLYASVTGLDPQNPSQPSTWGHTLRQPNGWWTCLQSAPNPMPLYAPLTLVLRPDPPSASWQDSQYNMAAGVNHFPVMKPDIGFEPYFDSLRDHMCGNNFTPVNSVQIRSYTRNLAIAGAMAGAGGVPNPLTLPTALAGAGVGALISVTGGCYSPQVQTDQAYFDFKGHMANGEGHVPASIWFSSEKTPMLARYVRYKA